MTDGEKIDLFLAISLANCAAALVNVCGLVAIRAAGLLLPHWSPVTLVVVLAVDAAVWIPAFRGARRAISG